LFPLGRFIVWCRKYPYIFTQWQLQTCDRPLSVILNLNKQNFNTKQTADVICITVASSHTVTLEIFAKTFHSGRGEFPSIKNPCTVETAYCLVEGWPCMIKWRRNGVCVLSFCVKSLGLFRVLFCTTQQTVHDVDLHLWSRWATIYSYTHHQLLLHLLSTWLHHIHSVNTKIRMLNQRWEWANSRFHQIPEADAAMSTDHCKYIISNYKSQVW